MLHLRRPAVKWQMFDVRSRRSDAVFYLVVVYQVENQVYVSVYGLVLSQLRFHSVQPVDKSLESICELAGEQQGLLQLVLSAGENKSVEIKVYSKILQMVPLVVGGTRYGKKKKFPYLSTDLPQTVSHLSLSSLSMSSSFWLSS